MKLYNTLTRNIEDFKPLSNKEVKVYTCGLTVYSQPHIGNWVSYIYWDILQRTLVAGGYKVNRVQNITDVGHLTSDEDAGEDKMVKGALKEGLTAWQVAEKYIKIADHEGFELLELEKPTHLVRATDYINQQIAFVEELHKKGFTYVIDDGIYFDTSKLNDYGKLAKLDIDGLQFGARVADTGKKNPTDFAVWKFSNPKEKRDMEWNNPLKDNNGKGFPGWHLECSVMAREILGDQIDIHTGGIDHIPVHHTNEIAQTEAITGKQFSQFWLHANHIKVNGTKMAKSLGNIITLKDIVDRGYDIQSFKLVVLSKHYRTEGNFTWEILEAAQNRLKHWSAAVDLLWQSKDSDNPGNKPDGIISAPEFEKKILELLQNDLNTPGALALIDETLSETTSSNLCIGCLDSIIQTIKELLGIDLLADKTDITDAQKQLLDARQAARDAKDWQKSDDIRDQLLDQGIAVRDTKAGQIWNRQ